MPLDADSAAPPRLAKKRRVQIAEPEFKNTPRRVEKSKSKPKKSSARRKNSDAASPIVKSNGKHKEPAPASASTPSSTPLPTHPHTFKIIAGSYEKLLYGLEGSFTSAPASPHSKPLRPWQLALKPIFIFPAHVSCIKAVAASPSGGKWLATGSADEIVKVWDLRRRKEVGGLVHHEGSITHLTFPSRSHLLSASEDGTLCLFHARDWTVLRVLKGHKGRVNALGVHPSGKLALSVGRDRTLRMWDLMRGKGAASTKLGKEGERVCWSPTGARFAVQAQSTVDLFSTKMALQCSITHPARVHDVAFFRPASADADLLLVAAEDKKVTVYEVLDDDDSAPPRVIAVLAGHTNRVKAIACTTVLVPPYTAETRTASLASTVSSDGFIRVFDLGEAIRARGAHAAELPVVVEAVCVYDTKGSRLTCVAVGDGDMGEAGVGGKRKRVEEEDEDGGKNEGGGDGSEDRGGEGGAGEGGDGDGNGEENSG